MNCAESLLLLFQCSPVKVEDKILIIRNLKETVEAVSLKAAGERVSYCGLYCGCCVMEEARVLSDALRKRIGFFGKYEDQVPELRGNWRSFMKVLDFFGQKCNGCRQGGGDPNCQIRVCAQERGVFFCGECEDFPCEKIGRYKESIEEIMKMGMEKWLEKQQRKTEVILKPIFAE